MGLPKSFRFTEDTKNKLQYIAKVEKNNNTVEIERLIEERFKIVLEEQLDEIVKGKNPNMIEDLIYLLKNNLISKEYFLYSLPVPPKVRTIVLKSIEESEINE